MHLKQMESVSANLFANSVNCQIPIFWRTNAWSSLGTAVTDKKGRDAIALFSYYKKKSNYVHTKLDNEVDALIIQQ